MEMEVIINIKSDQPISLNDLDSTLKHVKNIGGTAVRFYKELVAIKGNSYSFDLFVFIVCLCVCACEIYV